MADGWGEVDFRGPGGVGLEVKQGAALQNWHEPGAKASQPRFDIAMRKNHVLRDGTVVQQRGRSAEIYVFAWHPVTDPAVCDHRDPAQWEFYVVRADALPDQKSIGLAGVRGLIQKVSVNRILAATNYTLTQLAR